MKAEYLAPLIQTHVHQVVFISIFVFWYSLIENMVKIHQNIQLLTVCHQALKNKSKDLLQSSQMLAVWELITVPSREASSCDE